MDAPEFKPTSATFSALIPFPARRIVPRRTRDQSDPALVTALRDALEVVDFCKQRCHPAMGEALDTLTEEAREVYSRVHQL
jgi:hypothetical protein